MNLLIWLVAFQLLLLLAMIFFQAVPGFRSVGMADSLKESPADKVTAEENKLTSKPPVVPTPETGALPPEVPLERPVRIEILNGCGVPKLAARYAELLRRQGYDIRSTGNAKRLNYSNSLILDHTKLKNQAERLGELLGISSQRITYLPDPNLVDIDLTIILGRDYKRLKIKP